MYMLRISYFYKLFMRAYENKLKTTYKHIIIYFYKPFNKHLNTYVIR